MARQGWYETSGNAERKSRVPPAVPEGRVGVKLGHAVVRNRARRRLREVYRVNSGALKQGYDIILVARGKTVSTGWKELNDTFLRLCRKLELMGEGV